MTFSETKKLLYDENILVVEGHSNSGPKIGQLHAIFYISPAALAGRDLAGEVVHVVKTLQIADGKPALTRAHIAVEHLEEMEKMRLELCQFLQTARQQGSSLQTLRNPSPSLRRRPARSGRSWTNS